MRTRRIACAAIARKCDRFCHWMRVSLESSSHASWTSAVGAEGVIGAFTAHRPGSNAPQLVVHERKHVFHTSLQKIPDLRSQNASTRRDHVWFQLK